MLFDNVGKDKDPNFDFKRELVGNLGDDLITFQKNPRTNNLASLSSPPSLLLIGSPNAEKLADAIHTVTSSTLLGPMLGQSGGKEREFLGRKIYSVTLPGGLRPDGSMAQNMMSYAAGGGYLRQFPLRIIRRAFREANERSVPATFYIHPWEIDPGQPRLPVSVFNQLRHYRGLATTLDRLDQLLAEFRFRSIASYLSAESSATPPARAGAA